MTSNLAKAGWRFKQPSVIPGFGLTLGFTLAYLALIVLIPLTGLVWRSASLGFPGFWHVATDPRTINALKISFGTSLIAAMINVVFGVRAGELSMPSSICHLRCRRRWPALR